jgi:peptide-methionine (S)-S-oxide reductase
MKYLSHLFLSALLFLSSVPISMAQAKAAKATFAGGCFWSVEAAFESLDGVVSATSGFTGGTPNQPNYQQVSGGSTGHVEAVEIVYDPEKISYQKLLEIFWKNIDPTDAEGQFCDRGPQYRTAIFYHDPQQKVLAEKSEAEVETILQQKVVTSIAPASTFFVAEEFHQDFTKKKKMQYMQYKMGCGRDRRLRQVWGEKKEN